MMSCDPFFRRKPSSLFQVVNFLLTPRLFPFPPLLTLPSPGFLALDKLFSNLVAQVVGSTRSGPSYSFMKPRGGESKKSMPPTLAGPKSD